MKISLRDRAVKEWSQRKEYLNGQYTVLGSRKDETRNNIPYRTSTMKSRITNAGAWKNILASQCGFTCCWCCLAVAWWWQQLLIRLPLMWCGFYKCLCTRVLHTSWFCENPPFLLPFLETLNTKFYPMNAACLPCDMMRAAAVAMSRLKDLGS